MADVLTRSEIFFVVGPRSVPLRSRKRAPCCVGFARSSHPPFKPLRSAPLSSDFHGRKLIAEDQRLKPMRGNPYSLNGQMSMRIGKSLKWWENGIQPNMKAIESAPDLVDSMLSAGNKLAVLDFFSPGCGGCRALHPKVCKFAEMNPDVVFLHVNYEEHRSMCQSLNVHVLPFFRFYRGAHGRLCSFSCTNATIKKFKDALAKHTTDRCSLGPVKGLEESELMALAANKELAFNYTRKPVPVLASNEIAEPVLEASKLYVPSSLLRVALDSEENALTAAGR